MDRSQYNRRESWRQFYESSVNTPDFQKKKATNQLPENPYTLVVIEGRSPLGSTREGPRTERDVAGWVSVHDTCAYGGLQNTGHGIGPFISHPTYEYMHQTLRNKLNRKLRDTPIDLGVALGEYRSTAALLSGAMNTIRGLASNLRRFNYKDAYKFLTVGDDPRLWANNSLAVNHARAAADAWLGFTYGVKPLLSDCLGAVELLSRPKNTGHQIKVKVSHSEQIRGTCRVVVGPHETIGDLDGVLRGSAQLILNLDDPFAFSLYQTGILNPLQTAWELIPYSFVVDWFAPVGQVIGGLQPAVGVSLARGSTWVTMKGISRRRTKNLPGQAYTWNTEGSAREVYKNRRVLTQIPKYEAILPDISLSRDQLLSGVSLLVQQVTRENSGSPLARVRAPRVT